MSLELSSLNAEDMLNDVGENYDGWDLSWELDEELLDLLDDNALPEEHNGNGQGNGMELMPDDVFDWSALEDELPRVEQAQEQSKQEEDQRQREEEEKQQQFERDLAKLDGEADTDSQTPPWPSPSADLAQPLSWNILGSLTSHASILVSRLCFARHLDAEYKIYDAFDDMGYHYLGTPLLLKRSGSTELQSLQQLNEEYMHLFAYTELPDYVKQLIIAETGEDVPRMLQRSDNSCCSIDGPVMCVARTERVEISVNSSTVSSALETHSGINVFGEPTRISITIHSREIVLANAMLIHLVNKPDTDVFLVASANNIYIINGRILLESSDLARHVLPIRNIDLIVYSPRQFAL
ncbi:hypothetical protein ACLKA7_006881 [Drosophila subpalustris]